MNKEFRRMQQLAGLLTEINIAPKMQTGVNTIVPLDLKKALKEWEDRDDIEWNVSPEDDEPASYSQTMIEENGPDDNVDAPNITRMSPESYSAFKKYIDKKFITNDFFTYNTIPSPQIPERKGYNTLITIEGWDYPNNQGVINPIVEISIPNCNEEGFNMVNTGWFNEKGEYISTVHNVNEVNIAPTGNTPKLYVSSVDDGVYKITGVNRFTSPDIILKICTSISNEAYGDADIDDPDYDVMEEEIKPAAKALAKEASKIDPTNPTPLYAGTDGNISFHTLSNMLRYSPDIEQGDWLPQNI